MDNRIAYKVKKTSSKTSVKNLLKEMYREEDDKEKYDDGIRDLHPEKTKDNVWLDKPDIETFDKNRKEKIKDINKKRADRTEEEYTAYDRRSLRSDTVDLLSIVIQPSKDWLGRHTDEEAEELLRESYEMMKDNPDEYGEIMCGSIHFDESSAHMQVLSSTLDDVELCSKAKKLVGNRKEMSEKQTKFADGLRERGFDVDRGVNRTSQNYLNWKLEMEEKYGTRITRHNEDKFRQLEEQERSVKDMVIKMGQETGKIDFDGNYYVKQNDGSKKPEPVKNMDLAQVLEIGAKSFDSYQRIHDLDIKYLEDEYDELSTKVDNKRSELDSYSKRVENNRIEYNEIVKDTGKKRTEHESIKKDIEGLKLERESEQSKNLRLKRENDKLHSTNVSVQKKNEILENRNRFLNDVVEMGHDNDEITKKQDTAIVSYLRYSQYRNDPKSFSDLLKKSFDFVEKQGQHRYGSHLATGTPKKSMRSKSKDDFEKDL